MLCSHENRHTGAGKGTRCELSASHQPGVCNLSGAIPRLSELAMPVEAHRLHA